MVDSRSIAGRREWRLAIYVRWREWASRWCHISDAQIAISLLDIFTRFVDFETITNILATITLVFMLRWMKAPHHFLLFSHSSSLSRKGTLMKYPLNQFCIFEEKILSATRNTTPLRYPQCDKNCDGILRTIRAVKGVPRYHGRTSWAKQNEHTFTWIDFPAGIVSVIVVMEETQSYRNYRRKMGEICRWNSHHRQAL